MRIWDLPVSILCRNHLLGEHRELHAIWNILVLGKKSPYINHPETKRWVGRLRALYRRHEDQVDEMKNRGWNHKTPLEGKFSDEEVQTVLIESVQSQIENIKNKKCKCKLEV